MNDLPNQELPPSLVRAATVRDAGAIGSVHVAAWRAAYDGLMPREFLAFGEATLWVLHGNRRARHFYEALGWRLDGTERIESELTGSPLHRFAIGFP